MRFHHFSAKLLSVVLWLTVALTGCGVKKSTEDKKSEDLESISASLTETLESARKTVGHSIAGTSDEQIETDRLKAQAVADARRAEKLKEDNAARQQQLKEEEARTKQLAIEVAQATEQVESLRTYLITEHHLVFGLPVPDLKADFADFDPWGHRIDVLVFQRGYRQSVKLISRGPDGESNTSDDITAHVVAHCILHAEGWALFANFWVASTIIVIGMLCVFVAIAKGHATLDRDRITWLVFGLLILGPIGCLLFFLMLASMFLQNRSSFDPLHLFADGERV